MGVPVGKLGMSYNRMLAVAGLMTSGVILTSFAAVAMLVITFLQIQRPIFHVIPPVLSLPPAFFYMVAFSVWASIHADVYAKANPLVYESHLGASFGLAIMAFIITTVGGSAATYLTYITYKTYSASIPTTVTESVAVASSDSVPGMVEGHDIRVDMQNEASPFVIADEESEGPHDSREYLKQAPGVVTPSVQPPKVPAVQTVTPTSRAATAVAPPVSTVSPAHRNLVATKHVSPIVSSPAHGDEIYTLDEDVPKAEVGTLGQRVEPAAQTKAHPATDVPESAAATAAGASTTSSHRRNVSTA